MSNLIAIILWLWINYIFWWTAFNTLICIIAWLFLIMPFLLKLSFKELISFNKEELQILKISIFNIFVFNLFIFFIIPYIIFWLDKILYWFILLWLLTWWWMLLSWIKKTEWNTKLWFKLFAINFIIFSIILIPLNKYIENQYTDNNIETNNLFTIKNEHYFEWNNNINNLIWNINNTKENNEIKCVVSDISGWFISCDNNGKISPITTLIVLIVFPFILSRIIRFIRLDKYINKYITYISNISTFLLITYIFSLKEMSFLIYVNNIILFKIFISVFIIYLIIYLYNYFKLLKNINENSISLFWISSIRFITLWLVFSFVLSWYVWKNIILIFISAYIIQIILSTIFSYFINKKRT